MEFVRQTPTPAPKVFPFVFIDPWGWEVVAGDRVRPLLKLAPGEVLITFMSSFVARFLNDRSKPFERLLGEDEVKRLRTLTGEELEDELVASYARSVKQAGGYLFSCAVPVMDPKRDRFLFHMVYATRHAKGVEEFKKAEGNMIDVMHRLRAEAQRRRELKGGSSLFLFGAMDTYREERFSRFREKSLRAASIALEAKMQSGQRLFFQDLLNEGLQFSAVLEEDIRDLVLGWVEAGRVGVGGIPPKQKTLHFDTILEWVPF